MNEFPPQLRIPRVRERAAKALQYLTDHGPSTLMDVAAGIREELQRTRYALTTLRQDEKAHIACFERVVGADKIPRFIAIYQAGEGFDASLPKEGIPDPGRLDFKGTRHLQDVYVHCLHCESDNTTVIATRKPDDGTIWRHRRCNERDCGLTFYTTEAVAKVQKMPYIVRRANLQRLYKAVGKEMKA
jgi:hypothetical protein